MSFAPRRSRAKKPASPRTVLAYAGWLLARRGYTAAQLRDKFRTKFEQVDGGPDAESVFDSVLLKLQTLGLQSDAATAESFVRSKASWGRQRLKLELARRGVESELIESSLPDSADESARAAEVLAKKLKDNPIPTDFAERQKLAAFLARRGFGLDTIRQVLK